MRNPAMTDTESRLRNTRSHWLFAAVPSDRRCGYLDAGWEVAGE